MTQVNGYIDYISKQRLRLRKTTPLVGSSKPKGSQGRAAAKAEDRVKIPPPHKDS